MRAAATAITLGRAITVAAGVFVGMKTMSLWHTKHSSVNDALSLTGRLAQFFDERPNRWINGLELAGVAGSYAWRTRVSDLRRAPFFKNIENRVRRGTRPDGSTYAVSEYRWVSTGEGAAERVSARSAAV